MIIMVYVGMRLDWSISVYQEADVFSAFRLMPQLLSEVISNQVLTMVIVQCCIYL